MGTWNWAAASRRGVAHERCDEARQDAFRIVSPPDNEGHLSIVVCDGAGSASHGGAGAAVAAWTLASCARSWLAATRRLPEPDGAACWVLLARERIQQAAARRNLAARDFATTVVAVVSDGSSSLTIHIGDGAVAARNSTGAWITLSWPEQGEYASTTRFLTDESAMSLRIERHDFAIDRLAVMSDGLERLALDFRTGQPHAAFLEPMAQPLASRGGRGHDVLLSRSLASYLDGDRVNQRTDDDKTLVLAVLR